MIPAEGKEIVNVLVNGADRTDDIVFDEASGAYQLKFPACLRIRRYRCISASQHL